MSRSIKLAALAAVAVTALSGCSGSGGTAAQLSISATPGSIDDLGESSTITVAGTTESGTVGAGSVKVTSTAGSLKGDGQTVSLDAMGKATVMFSCAVATDPKCMGPVKLTADWTRSGGTNVSNFRNIQVGAGAGGGGGSSDGGGGAGGAGGSGGDGGTTVNTVVLSSQKLSLVVGTGDKTELTARVTVSATGAAVANIPVAFATSLGSFAPAPGITTVMVMTDAQGNARTTLFVAGASSGSAVLTAAALDGTGRVTVPFVSVASILVQPDPSVKLVLGTQSGGIETTTPVLFKVVDASNKPAPNIEVSFSIGFGSPSGATVTMSGTSNMMGIAQTTLQSGDAVGPVSVIATVTATQAGMDGGSSVPITATATITITGGKPSYRGLVVNCARKNMSALTDPAGLTPTRMLSTTCTASLADRFSQTVGFPKAVSWYAERGTIVNSMSTNGLATTTYNTSSNDLPTDTAPLTNPLEPSNGSANPRDNFITIIAVVTGEEEFTDTNGNGKWDPGEWFLDLPEPFVDFNDNQRWDQGEEKFDTQRLNCATGLREVENGQWDGPNGCWDNNTQLWAPTHIAWSGTLSTPIVFTPPPPWSVAINEVKVISFTWSDPWFNRMSADAPSITVALVGSRGTATLAAPNATAEVTGHSIAYEKVEATETATGSGVFNIAGPCDTGTLDGGVPLLTRCLHRYRFTSFGLGNTGTLTLQGASAAQAALPDGGIPGPVNTVIRVSGRNTYFTPAIQDFAASFQ